MVLPVFPRNIPYRERPKSPPFQFFSALRDIFFRIFFSKFFFLKRSPCIFLMFCDRMDVEKPQRVSLSIFRHCETLARHSVQFFSMYFFQKKVFEKFSIFDFCKRILDTWKSFCYFWALDMAPTWAGPGLLEWTKRFVVSMESVLESFHMMFAMPKKKTFLRTELSSKIYSETFFWKKFRQFLLFLIFFLESWGWHLCLFFWLSGMKRLFEVCGKDNCFGVSMFSVQGHFLRNFETLLLFSGKKFIVKIMKSFFSTLKGPLEHFLLQQ